MFREKRSLIVYLAASLMAAFIGQSARVQASTFTNPVLPSGADPWVVYTNGYYYFTETTGWDVRIYRTTRLAGTNGISVITNGVFTDLVAWYVPSTNVYHTNVWGPELHIIRGNAYVYYAADDGNNANHRMFVAQLMSNNSFVYKGKIYDPSSDCWAIDGTVLEADNGALYFIWSGWPGSSDGLQNLYIAPMSDPLTISGPRVLLSTPKLPWESWIEEGPAILKRNGKVFVIYAANQSWTDNECLGMLVNSDGNYLNPASWTKMSNPVFQTYVGSNGAVYGPGHCSLTQSLDGTEDWIVYHAATNSGSGWNRSIRMQSFKWDSNGYPNFGQPTPAGISVNVPSGDDYTPSRFNLIAPQSSGAVHIQAQAPLPLSTQSWAVQISSNFSAWSTLTNVSGTNFSVDFVDKPGSTNRFYRVKSTR